MSLVVALATMVACLAGCGSASPKMRSPSAVATDIPAAVRSDDGLAIALLNRLGQGAGNTVFSPYSIETALAMVDAGAAGSTATEIDRVLETSRPAELAAGLAAVNARLSAGSRAKGAPQLHLADGLWVQSGFALRQPFTRTLSSRFGAPPQLVDFAHAPNAARQTINAWVAARTARLITDLFPTGTITNQTALVLANAIHLQAHWADPFDPAQTAPAPFYPGAGGAVEVPFMSQRPSELSYARVHGYEAVDLHYDHSTLSMLLILPPTGTLRRFEQGLSPSLLTRIALALRPKLLYVRLPKLHLTFHAALEPVLSDLGMPVAFTDAADFSGITTQTSLKISAVEHAADLRVDEQGTVAAAATGIAIEPTAISPDLGPHVTFDHPFLLFLRDDATGAILFAGQVTNPA